jgi:transcription initiation factor IIE alpha subunit
MERNLVWSQVTATLMHLKCYDMFCFRCKVCGEVLQFFDSTVRQEAALETYDQVEKTKTSPFFDKKLLYIYLYRVPP